MLEELARSCKLLDGISASLIRIVTDVNDERALTELRAACAPDAPYRAVYTAGEKQPSLRVLSGSPAGQEVYARLPGGEPVQARSLCLTDGGDAVVEERPLEDGEVICPIGAPCIVSDAFSLHVLWLGDEPLYVGRAYVFRTPAGQTATGIVGKIKARLAPRDDNKFVRHIEKGDCAIIEVELDDRLVHDSQDTLSPLSFGTLTDDEDGRNFGVYLVRFPLRRADNVKWQDFQIGRRDRAALLGQKPIVVWFTGLSGSGKSTTAAVLEKKLYSMGRLTYVLDGDNVRHGLCRDLGFTEEDRVENLRRVAEVARLMMDAGLIVLVSFISPFQHERDRARSLIGEDSFLEIFVDTPLEECERRDVKGLYAKARAGLIKNFTGIDSPYEPPSNPDLHLRGDRMSPEEMADVIIEHLHGRGVLRG